MLDVDFLFLMEHEDREGKLAKLLTSKLTELGISSKVLSIEFHLHLLKAFRPRVVVVPYAINSLRYPLCFFHDKQYSETNFISLNWEQLLSDSNKKFKSPKCKLVQSGFNHLAWSDDFKEFLVAAGVKDSKIRVIGNPNIELLSDAIKIARKDICYSKKELGLVPNKQVIFFPMNYGWAFATDKVINGKIRQGYNGEVAWKYKSYSYQCLEKFIFFVYDVAMAYSDCHVVIRPHPSISNEQYEDMFKAMNVEIPENILITKSFTVKEWISVSDIVGSSWSTTVWDCYQMGIPSFLFTPIERPAWLNTKWNDKVNNICSLQQFSDLFLSKRNERCQEFTYVNDIFYWLLEVYSSQDVNFYNDFEKTDRLKCFFYKVRCFFRCFSAKYLKGVFLSKGSMRDYFDFHKGL